MFIIYSTNELLPPFAARGSIGYPSKAPEELSSGRRAAFFINSVVLMAPGANGGVGSVTADIIRQEGQNHCYDLGLTKHHTIFYQSGIH